MAFICGGLAAVGGVWAVTPRRGKRRAQLVAAALGDADDAAPPTTPALAGTADDLAALRTAVVDAAGVSAGLWLSYLFVLFYLLVAAGGVTHQALFFASPVKLPFLNVDLPLEGFFWLRPALLLIVHAYVLLHFVLLAGKVGAFDAQLRVQIGDADVRTQLRRQLPSNIFVQILAGPREVRDGVMGLLLWAITLVSLAMGPVSLLVFFQLQFLPYHHELITWWQRVAVAFDLALLWVLWRRIGLREAGLMNKGDTRGRWPVAFQRIGTVLAVPLLALSSVPLVFAVATFPGEWLERTLPLVPLRELLVAGEVDYEARKLTSWWSNRLVLPRLDVIDHAKLDSEAKIAALPETVSLRKRHLEGAVLIGAVLRKADLTGARLQGATLDGARLQEASLDNAQLQGATLNGARLQGATLNGAQLQGASLLGAQLQGASLGNAQLQHAWLEDASLQGASLYRAQLQGASLGGARLQGASLYRAQLQGASLGGAQLQGATLDYAQLQGASFNGAFVWRADARSANATNTLVENLVTGPKQPCAGKSETICDWSAADLSRLRLRIEQSVPEGKMRADTQARSIARSMLIDALVRIVQPLDPTRPLGGEDEIAKHWADLQHSSLTPDAYEAELAKQWRQIGCATEGAPFVLTGLIRTVVEGTPFLLKRLLIRTVASIRSPFAENSPRASQLAADFLKQDCAGARGLADDDKEELRKLRDRVPTSPKRPSAGARQP